MAEVSIGLYLDRRVVYLVSTVLCWWLTFSSLICPAANMLVLVVRLLFYSSLMWYPIYDQLFFDDWLFDDDSFRSNLSVESYVSA